jgi:L-gulonolactone oxidase
VDRRRHYWTRPRFRDELGALLTDSRWQEKLAIGLRRSYGDSCLNGAGAVIDATGLDRFIAFDPALGRVRAEAGVSLSEILKLVVPHG